jgi:serine/threonine protein kinase
MLSHGARTCTQDRLELCYDQQVDVWATGVVAYELLNGCPPFTCHDKKETEKRINSGLMPEFVVDVSDAARDFVYSCLARSSALRPTAFHLLRNTWIKVRCKEGHNLRSMCASHAGCLSQNAHASHGVLQTVAYNALFLPLAGPM